MYWLETGPLSQVGSPNLVYLCRPQIQYAKIISEHIRKHTADHQKFSYTVLLVPRVSTVIRRVFEDEGVLGDLTLTAYDLQFIPLEDDLISLEYEHAFRDIWLDGDETAIHDSAQALLTLERLYGAFPRILGKGDQALKAKNLLKRLQAQTPKKTPGSLSLSDKLDALIIIDRRVDMVTPLLTQLTYQGLIDELLGITSGHVELPASLLAVANAQQTPSAASTSASGSQSRPGALSTEKKKKHHLTATNDPLFRDLRDLNFSVVGATLSRHAHRLDAEYQSRHQARTVPQLKEFVGKLGNLQTETQALKLRTCLTRRCESIEPDMPTDTGLSEIIDPLTKLEVFNKALEIQQSV